MKRAILLFLFEEIEGVERKRLLWFSII